MQPRLLSFFSDIERSLEADQPSSPEGTWQNSRTVNYTLGLARLELGLRPQGGKIEPKGTILLQGYQLADESPCLKAALSWAGAEGSRIASPPAGCHAARVTRTDAGTGDVDVAAE